MAASEAGIISRAPARRQAESLAPAPKNSTIAGKANAFTSPARLNSTDTGCRRRGFSKSDGIGACLGQQRVTNRHRHAVLEARQPDQRVLGAGRVNRERAETESPLDRSL